jgi:hypothetical protein
MIKFFFIDPGTIKGKAIPMQDLGVPAVEAPRIHDNRHDKV